MQQISLDQTIPSKFIKDKSGLNSEIWLNDLSFFRGKTYLIEAASGMGKSSLCSFIYGIRSDYGGSITFDNKDIRDIDKSHWNNIRRNSLSLLFQGLSLFDELTGMENVMLKNRLTDHKTKEQIEEMFSLLCISDKLNQRAGLMSFGQRQRVALIRALCQPFDFLLLDEPVSHLDNENIKVFSRLIEDEVRDQNAGLIVTSIGKHPEITYDKTLRL